MITKTKIIATLGPACDSQKMIEKMIKAGVSVFRFNTKHSNLAWHSERMTRVRKASEKLGIPVAILLVLRGPELRVGTFKNGQIELKKGKIINFVSQESSRGENDILVKELALIKGFRSGSVIYLDDGFLEVEVVKVFPGREKISARVIEGGILKSNKGINFPGADLSLPSLIKKDLEFISMANQKDIDFFSYSFVRNKEDILALRKILKKQGLKAKIVAKIETKQAIDNFEEIVKEADAVMVARGDLGVEISLEQVPFYQKIIVDRCREETKPVIIATQMLESMIQKPRPTRAEVNDVANAIYEGTDAVMLSAESASGLFPLKAIETMKKIMAFIEPRSKVPKIELEIYSLTEAMTLSASKILTSQYIAEMKIKSFVVFTDTGATPRFLSRLRPAIPILAITNSKQTRDQLCLSYGVIPFYHKFPKGKIRSTKYALEFLKKKSILKKGERVVLIYGKEWGVPGGTNTIRVEEVR